MPQRASNFDTLLMSLEILKRIPRVGKISAPDLRDQLEEAGFKRNIRTVQRQLDELSQHLDIERDDRSKPYGYAWKRDSRGLSITTLNETESMLLTLAQQHLRNLLPAGLTKSMEGFFEQARVKLSPDSGGGSGSHEAADWLRKVRVVDTNQPLLPPELKPGVFDAVSNALYSDHWLEVDYRNADGKQTQSRVMPLGLAQQGFRLFLVCRFDGYADDRSLALHRLLKAHDTGLAFERPADFDLRRFDDEGRFGFGDGKTIELKFRLPQRAGLHLTESRLSRNQVVRAVGDSLEFTATVVESDQLRWWLRSFGSQLKLIKPRNLLADDV